jgi:prepilin-type N-terminal cleavage/methylation domain-containing protein
MQQISALKAFLVSVPEWRGLRLVLLPAVRGRRRKPAAAAYTDCKGAGFTLIELLVVVAIIAILAGLTLSTLGYVNRKGAESRARSEVAALAAAIDAFKLEFGSYPDSNNLYGELTGDANANGGAVINTNGKIFFEPTAQIIDRNSTPYRFIDPWGSPYNYTTNPSFNTGFFDLWTSNNATNNPELWIRN